MLFKGRPVYLRGCFRQLDNASPDVFNVSLERFIRKDHKVMACVAVNFEILLLI